MSTVQAVSSSQPSQTISTRSLKFLAGRSNYFLAVAKCYANLWSPQNPDGWLPLAVAENKLCTQMFLDKLATVPPAYPEWVMHYNAPRGTSAFRKTLAQLFEQTFLNGYKKMEPGNMCISSACSGILDNLFYVLADEGKGVFVPAPYYPAFDNDLESRNKLVPVPIHLDLEANIHHQLDSAAAIAAHQGNPISSLLITNPNNPLGIVYSEQIVTDMITWCLQNKVHYVSDEVYALSIFKPNSGFVSALNIAAELVNTSQAIKEDVDTYLHFVYGLSKDWGAAGLYVGVLYTRNEQVNKALSCLVSFNSVSLQTQHALSEIFQDIEWARSFVADNTKLLEKSYDTLTSALTAADIPFTAATACVFLWIDLSAWLPEPTWEAELELWNRLVYEGNVVITPGKDCHAAKPGHFRICYAQVDVEALAIAVGRIKKVLDHQ